MIKLINMSAFKETECGIFWKESVFCEWEEVYLIKCVICGKEEEQVVKVSHGLYTGRRRIPAKTPTGSWCHFKYGYKPTMEVCCDSHTEQEIAVFVTKQLTP